MQKGATEADSIIAWLERLCRSKGINLTARQRLIVRLISESRDHPDFAELYERVRDCNSGISRATLARTLTLFIRQGIVERHAFLGGRHRYEPKPKSHHDHLVDLSSGRVCEFNDPNIEILQHKIARQLGFELVGYKLELYAEPLSRAHQKK